MSKSISAFPATWQDEFSEIKFLSLEEAKRLPREQRFTILYIRVSTDEQSKRGYSIHEQGPLALQWAQGRPWHVYPVVPIIDEGQSGGIGWKEADKPGLTYRKGFDELIHLVRERRVANILSAYADRLSREDHFTQALAYDCRYYDTRIQCADSKEDLQAEENALLLAVKSAVASEQRRGGKIKVRDSLRRRVEQGLPPGTVPYGWKNHVLTEAELNEHRRPWAEPNEEEKRWLLLARGWFLSGLSFGQIATRLTVMGTPPPSKIGTRWHKEVVKSILLNPFHAGLFKYKGNLVKGRHAEYAFWSEEDCKEMERIYHRRKKTSHSFDHSDQHYLGKLIVCGTCCKPLRFGSDGRVKGGPRYYCQNGCTGIRARVELVDRYVLEKVKELARHPLTVEMAREEAETILQGEYPDDEEQIKHLERKHTELKGALQRAYNGWCRNLVDEEQYMIQKNQFDEEIKAVKAELDQFQGRQFRHQELIHRLSEVVEVIQDFGRVWNHLDRRERRELLHLVCERLVLENVEGQAVLKVKVFFLPEMSYPLPSYKDKSAWRLGDHQGLQITWLHCAKLKLEGLSDLEIAERRHLDVRTVRTYWSALKKTMGMASLEDVLLELKPHLEAMDPDILIREPHGSARANSNPLTPNQMAAMKARLETGNGDAAAKKLGVSRSCFNSRLSGAYRKLGSSVFEEAVEKMLAAGTAVQDSKHATF